MFLSFSAADSMGRLSSEQAAELAAQVSELAKAGLPLEAGLRATADELPRGRLPRALRALADGLESGASLDAVVAAQGRRFPPHVRGLLLAGVRSGRLAEVLDEFVDIRRARTELHRRICLSLAYPALLMLMLVVEFALLEFFMVQAMAKMFADFEADLPLVTRAFLATSRPTLWMFLGLFAAAAAIPVVLWIAPRAAWVWRALGAVPLIGPALRWSHLAEFSRLTRILLEQQVPLTEALRLAADSVRDGQIAADCHRAADDVDGGLAPAESFASKPQFPPSMIPLIQWGQRANCLPDAFRAAAEMFESRSRTHGFVLETILPPIVFLMVLMFAGAGAVAMMLPLIQTIRLLT